MAHRNEVEKVLNEAYAARKRGDVDALCGCFGGEASFTMAGTREASPIALQALDGNTLRSHLTGLVATFEWLDQQILSTVIEGDNAAVHWRGRIRSNISGEEVVTELVDMFTIKDGKINSLIEFCDTALAARLMAGELASAERVMA